MAHDPLCPQPLCDYGQPDGECYGYADCWHHCECALIAKVRAEEVARHADCDCNRMLIGWSVDGVPFSAYVDGYTFYPEVRRVANFEEMTTLPVDLECEGCDATFQGTAQEAFDLGWDCQPWFFSHTTCPSCPITKTLWYMLYTTRTDQDAEGS